MDREEGLAILRDRGWLGDTPDEFREAILAGCGWQSLEPGAPIQSGGEDSGELIGLAQGIVELRTILGRADTPLMHLAHAVFWFGYVPILTGRPRGIAAAAKTTVWLARMPQAAVRALLDKRPEWWRHLMQLSVIYGELSQTVAADLLIRDSERRLSAVLLRLAGRRFAGPADSERAEVPITQDELAGAANLSRNSVGAMLHRLAKRGLIERGYGGVAIRAPAALRALVDGG